MDWAKAKTILIAVFLAINAFLGYVILGGNTGNIGYVDSENIKRVTDYLAEKNITMTGKIPDRKTDMSSLSVKYKLFSKEDILETLFSPEEEVAETVEGSTVRLVGKAVEASVTDSRELNYIDNSIRPSVNIDEKVCSLKIDEFLGRLDMKEDGSIKRVEDVEGYKRFVYSQSFKGAVIYNSTMEFYANDSGIYKATLVWFETVRQAGKKADVVSPVVALLSVPEHNKNNIFPSKEVIEIQQGYYFGTGVKEQLDVSAVVEGTAFPVWKITTDRDIIYINAYNEKVEGVEKARK